MRCSSGCVFLTQKENYRKVCLILIRFLKIIMSPFKTTASNAEPNTLAFSGHAFPTKQKKLLGALTGADFLFQNHVYREKQC